MAAEADGTMRGWLMAGLLALCAAGALSWGGTARAAAELGLHPEVWAAFEAYRVENRPGAFAVSQDGSRHGHSLCGAGACDLGAAKKGALQACRANGGGACVVFAVRDDVKLAYRLLSRAEISRCPLAPVPEIRVTLAVDETSYDHGYKVADLGRMMGEDGRHWLDEHGTVMGLTEQFFDIERRLLHVVEMEGRDETRCVGYADGELPLRLGARIYVANEIPYDTCLYHEVLEHEHKHRALGADMTAGLARDLEAAIAAALAEAPYTEVPPGAKPRLVAERRLDEIIDAVYAVFRREHSRQQLAIDSDAEYRRVDTVCPGETDKYVP